VHSVHRSIPAIKSAAQIELDALKRAHAAAFANGDYEVAYWLEAYIEEPDWTFGNIQQRIDTAQGLAKHGRYVRRKATDRKAAGRWHLPNCEYALSVRRLDTWEGTDAQPSFHDALCTCVQETLTKGFSPDVIRDEVSKFGNYVRRKASTNPQGEPVPPGPWHRAGCGFIKLAHNPGTWEGLDALPEDSASRCKKCFKPAAIRACPNCQLEVGADGICLNCAAESEIIAGAPFSP